MVLSLPRALPSVSIWGLFKHIPSPTSTAIEFVTLLSKEQVGLYPDFPKGCCSLIRGVGGEGGKGRQVEAALFL